MDGEPKKKALWRLGVLGPLISARLQHGDRRKLFQEAAARSYEDADGRRVELTVRTVEEWYYRFRHGGMKALEPRRRSDAGKSRVIRPETAELIVAAKRENPRRSIRRLIRMLERAKKVQPNELKKSTVHRLLRARGLSGRPRRHTTERRAFRHAKPGDLWMGDVMHGPVVIAPDHRRRKSYLHLFIDSAVRFVPGCAFRLAEKASDHQAVLKQAVLKHGPPRTLYLDLGAAQTSDSLKIICAELAIRLLHCRPFDPQAKAGVERFFRTVREELLDELPHEPLELGTLNGFLWSWLAAEYHQRIHGGTGRAPLEHWLSQVEDLRPAPPAGELDRIFLHRAQRKVRRDSTVRFEGRMLEVRSELCGQKVELRFDPELPDVLPAVYVDGRFYCDTVELDVVRNSRRRRRRVSSGGSENETAPPASGLDPLGLIQAEHDRRRRPPGQRNNDDKED
jgi:transposase InsO family protein